MAQLQSNVQYQNNFLWTLLSPIVAMLVAVPLSVALVTNIIHKELAADTASLKQAAATQMAPAAYQTASAQTGCVGQAQATQATATTPAVVQTASVKMPASTWANPMHSSYAKSYTKVSNSYTSTSTKNIIVGSYNNNSKNWTQNENSGNTTTSTVTTTNNNTASGGSVINSSTSSNTTSVNGDKNMTGVYNNQSSSASSTTTNTTTTIGSNNGNNSHNNNGSYNNVDSHDKTKVDVDVDSHDKTGTFDSYNDNFSHNFDNNKVKVD